MKTKILFLFLIISITFLFFGCIDVISVYDYNKKYFVSGIVGANDTFILEQIRGAISENGLQTSKINEIASGYYVFAAEIDVSAPYNLYTVATAEKDRLTLTMELDKIFDLSDTDVRELLLYEPTRGVGVLIINHEFDTEAIYINNRLYGSYKLNSETGIPVVSWYTIYNEYINSGHVAINFIFEKKVI